MATSDPLGDELAHAQETGQVFAVVDAAHFEYLQDTLTAERFTFDPLYLDEVDNPSIASGPHLVHLTGQSQITKLRRIVGNEPACVWWVWPDVAGAGEAIRRHLRGLNMAELPCDRFDVEDSDRKHGYEPVLMRHADSNVMAMLLPIFEDDQVSRLFGGARGILVDAPDVCGVRLFERPDDLPDAPRGLLRIKRGAQYRAVADGYTDTLRNRAVREFESRFDTPTEEDRQRIESAFDRADGYGLENKDQIWKFIDLDLNVGAHFEDAPHRVDLKKYLLSDDPNGAEKLVAASQALSPETVGEA